MSLEQQIQDAIAAHGAWKSRLLKAVQTRQIEITPEVASRDDACAFGKWLGQNSECAAHTRCSKVRGLHAGFHREAGRILKLALEGKQADASRLLQSESEFSTISGALVIEMMAWLRDAGRAAGKR
jgi:methyl-accepting chemotaxis protein